LLMALIYSALAGFSIPTQRACLMLTFFLLALLMRRKIGAWYAWSCALLCVLLLNPLTVLTESFCLSFGSVALIIYGVSGRLSPKGLWWQWGRIQWVIALGLIPLFDFIRS
jgi:competence protein ComEC